ncbi:hypothetical protein I7I51_01524 [Histoplasma capsulatum]|uniref:Uncharacterized protein n=1 Tax=Ajellomyces capsulatus TaxID=5037 RepID=A0A8A1MD78_AJECA|nr:hypothetical protein I7I51_01524 [Histoplasma capsulatum]
MPHDVPLGQKSSVTTSAMGLKVFRAKLQNHVQMKKRCESARLESIITLPGLSPPRTIRRYIRSTTSQMDRRFTVAASDTSIGRTWNTKPVTFWGKPGPYRRQHHQTLVPGLRDVTFPPAPLPSRPALPDKINSTSTLDSPPLLPPLPPPSIFPFAASVSYLGKPSGYPDLRRNLRQQVFQVAAPVVACATEKSWPQPSALPALL